MPCSIRAINEVFAKRGIPSLRFTRILYTHSRSLSLPAPKLATEDVGFPHGRLKWRRKEGVEGQGSVHSDARRINIHLRKPAICSRSPSTYLQWWWWWWWVHAWKSVRARLVETGLFKRHCTPTFDVNPPLSIKYATMTPLYPLCSHSSPPRFRFYRSGIVEL